jgi:hypothetical protein
LDLVEEFGFKYDSSLMGRDLQAYHPQRWQINWEKGNVAGRASRLLEIPVCWYIDDFPVLAYSHPQRGQQDTDTVLKRWCSMFDYAYERVDSPVFVSVVHPQVIGHGIGKVVFRVSVWPSGAGCPVDYDGPGLVCAPGVPGLPDSR